MNIEYQISKSELIIEVSRETEEYPYFDSDNIKINKAELLKFLEIENKTETPLLDFCTKLESLLVQKHNRHSNEFAIFLKVYSDGSTSINSDISDITVEEMNLIDDEYEKLDDHIKKNATLNIW